MKDQHSPLHPVCAIVVKYKNGKIERNEFGSHAAKGQRMMHLHWDEVESVEEVQVEENWRRLDAVAHDVITKLGDLCSTTKK
jgi:hypothetical protein